jgi:hypothetical protein
MGCLLTTSGCRNGGNGRRAALDRTADRGGPSTVGACALNTVPAKLKLQVLPPFIPAFLTLEVERIYYIRSALARVLLNWSLRWMW